MRDFKSFQAQLQKRKAQLVKVRTIFSFFSTSKANPACREKQHLEEEMVQLRRIHEREMELFSRTQQAEFEKLGTKHKKDTEDFSKKQAKDTKTQEEEVCDHSWLLPSARI